MEFVERRGSSSSGAAGLLVVPTPKYLDVDLADLDDEDGEVVFCIRPKSSPQPRRKTSVSEDDSEISEPPSLCGSRRVSFADTIGLSLVQVKEFDKWDVPQLPDFLDSASRKEEEYFISSFNFRLSSPPEIVAKVQDQKIELESIELLPGTTTLKGVIRVLNISFTKVVYVRTSLDNWVSHFDLLSEYVPGSGDGQTDSFAFKLTLVPPFGEQGTRVDFCLRYETPVGTFWANNSNRNYVLFCYKRKKEAQEKPQKENANKKSCLKIVSQSSSVDESMSFPEQEKIVTDVTQLGQKVSNENPSSQINNNSSPVGNSEEDGQTSQVENKRNRSRRNRRKAARMARVRDYFSQKDVNTNDSENEPSPGTQTETGQEQNQAETYSDPKENVKLEDNPDASLSKDSNSKTEKHESINLADSATLTTTGDSPDESKDLPNAESAFGQCQNINKFIPTAEERSQESASDCSEERDNRERLVSNSSGYAFGTVVAPLYHQVSGSVGSQPYTETYSSVSRSKQQDRDERNINQEMEDDCIDTDLCSNAESNEQGEATSGTVETLQDANELEDSGQVSTVTPQPIQTCVISNPCPLNSLNHAQEKILGHKRETQDADLSCDLQETIGQDVVQSQLLENAISHSCIDKNREETVFESEQNSSFDMANQPDNNNTNDVTDEPSLEHNAKIKVLSPSNATFQEENLSLSFQPFQNECLLDHLANTSDVSGELSLEFENKTMAMTQSHASVSCEEENPPLLLKQNGGLSDQPSNMSDVISEPSLDSDAVTKIASPSHVSKASKEEKPPLSPQFSHSEGLPDPSKVTDELSLKIDDETMAAVSPSHVSVTSKEENSSLLLQKERFSDQPTKTRYFTDKQSLGWDAGGTIPASPSLECKLSEHPSLSLHLSKNEGLSHQPINFNDPEDKLKPEHDFSKTVAISPRHASATSEEENQSLSIELSQNKCLCLEDQPTNTSDLALGQVQDLGKTVPLLANEEETKVELDTQEKIANPAICFEALKEKEDIKSCMEIGEELISKNNTDACNKTIQMQGVGEVAESKEDMKYCHLESDVFAKDEDEEITISENIEQCEIETQITTMDIHLADENWEVMVEQEEMSIGDLQTEKEEELEVEDNMLVSLESEMALQKETNSAKPTKVVVRSIEEESEVATKDSRMKEDAFETVQEQKMTNEEMCLETSRSKMLNICTNYEENKEDCAENITEQDDRSGAKCIKMNENELGECIESKTMALMENMPQFECADVDITEERKVKIQLKTDEEKRLDTVPHTVECNLSAMLNNVQEDGKGSREDEQKKTDMPSEIGKKDNFPCSKNETSDWSEGASEVNESTFAEEEDLKDDDSHSSGSEDEMELYMHCLRAVYGQQSSPKATKPEQNREKEFKRLPITRSKRLSTSLPSISESVDEEQQLSSQEKDSETVEVQHAAPALPDLRHEEENVNYLWWKETFSCRNILKTLLYTTLAVIFLAVAYHYDFIACFGLYVISVVWLCCQGERQSSKNNRVS